MSVIVQKYGGTSVGDAQRIKRVADRVASTRSSGADVVVVVSAMGKTTDDLVALAKEVSESPPPREMDMLLTAGERVSMALLAMALDVRGVPAVSFTGSQAGILTDSSHGEARILRITGERVKDSLDSGKVVIVAGFQGVDPQSKEITTLGRGGSDTTAVALAATLGSEACEINTDVAGVFTADPRIVPNARKIDRIGYGEMYEMAVTGAGVLMAHSVDFASRFAVPVHVRSSFSESDGTWVTANAAPLPIAGLAHAISGERGAVSIVGSAARQSSDIAVETLEMAGMPSAIIEETDFRVTIGLPAEFTEDAVRILHGSLVAGSASQGASNE